MITANYDKGLEREILRNNRSFVHRLTFTKVLYGFTKLPVVSEYFFLGVPAGDPPPKPLSDGCIIERTLKQITQS